MACVIRGVTEAANFKYHLDINVEDKDDTPYLFLGHSWFGLVKTTSNVQIADHHVYFMVKLAHSRIPKSFQVEYGSHTGR